MSGRLEGRVALITGTGGGQGRTAALRFAAEGALVVGCDVKEEGSRETVRMVQAAGGTMTAMEPVDLGDPDGAAAWVQEAIAIHGRVDILYNNASAARFAPIAELSVEDWQFTIRNELDLVFYVTRAAWPALAERGGVILNIGSIQGMIGVANTGGIAHQATKAAVIAITKQMAVEGAPVGIRVNSISPGMIETPGTAAMIAQVEVKEMLLAPQLIKRVAQPEDVVNLALFLVSDESQHITGANMVIDGGVTAH